MSITKQNDISSSELKKIFGENSSFLFFTIDKRMTKASQTCLLFIFIALILLFGWHTTCDEKFPYMCVSTSMKNITEQVCWKYWTYFELLLWSFDFYKEIQSNRRQIFENYHWFCYFENRKSFNTGTESLKRKLFNEAYSH